MTKPNLTFDWKVTIGNVVTLGAVIVAFVSFNIETKEKTETNTEAIKVNAAIIRNHDLRIQENEKATAVILQRLTTIDESIKETALDVKQLLREKK